LATWDSYALLNPSRHKLKTVGSKSFIEIIPMDLETSIITSPNNDLSLDKEIRLLKSALLYSDSITLISPGLTTALYLLRLSSLSEKEKIAYLNGLSTVDPTLQADDIENAIKIRNILTRKKGKTKEEILKLEYIKQRLKSIDKYFEQWGQDVFIKSGLPEFYHLIENGTIKPKHLDVNETEKSIAIQILDETIDTISKKGVYPIFDNLVEQMASIYLKENKTDHDITNINEIFVGKEFLLKLPNIDTLTFADILTAKQELKTELDRFKNLINNYSLEIDGLSFDEQNRTLIEKKYQYDFLPQVKELQEKIDANKFYKHLMRDIGENFTKYSICLGVTGTEDIMKLALGAGGMTIAEGIYKGLNSSKQTDKEAKKSSVYFYHKLLDQ
jgi:hypothetical protein